MIRDKARLVKYYHIAIAAATSQRSHSLTNKFTDK